MYYVVGRCTTLLDGHIFPDPIYSLARSLICGSREYLIFQLKDTHSSGNTIWWEVVVRSCIHKISKVLLSSIVLAANHNSFTVDQDAMGVILKDVDARSKPCGVFGSFGWSGEAVDEIEQLLKDGGFSFAFPTLRCKFKVSSWVVVTLENMLFKAFMNGPTFLVDEEN